MRHRHAGKKLNRSSAHRRATLRNLAVALTKHEQIITTLAKAKALRPFFEKLVTLSRREDLHARRLVYARLPEKRWAAKMFEVLGPRYAQRPGGYTRIIRAGFRRGDSAPRAVIELVERDQSARGQDSGPPPQKKEVETDS